MPVQMPASATITPLGHIGPVGHVLPTDHVYFYSWDIDQPGAQQDNVVRDVLAPGDGVITWILLQQFGVIDYKVMFRMTESFYWYVDHVQLDPALKVGSVVRAGDKIGVTNPGGALDLGAFDKSTQLGFLVPERYPEQTLRCVSPFKYFSEPLRSSIYAKIRRVASAPDRDGRIDYDSAGTLAGNWFHESVPKTQESSGPAGWPKSLAFAYDYKDPAVVRVSIGGHVSPPGAWSIPPEAPRPENVSLAGGAVGYRLMYQASPTQWGLMMVEMQAPDRIRVQVFPGNQSGSAPFDNSAQIYVR